MKEKLVAYGIFFIGCVAIVFAFAYWMKDRDDDFAREMRKEQSQLKLAWDTWQKNVHLKYVSYDDLNEVLLTMKNNSRDEFTKLCQDSAGKYKLLRKDITDVQDHCARLREGQYDLQNQVSKKRPLIKLPKGPIQLEILPGTYVPPKNMGGKKPKKAAGSK